MTSVLIRRDIEKEAHRESSMWKQKQRHELCIYKPRSAKKCQELPEVPEAKRKA